MRTVSKGDVVAFRLGAHHLTGRLDDSTRLDDGAGPHPADKHCDDSLLTAAGRCAVQDSPPGSALLALHARVQGVTPARLSDAFTESKSLLQTWCMRGAPFCFPTTDAPVFTTGVLPPTEQAARHLLQGVAPAVDGLGLSLGEAVELTRDQIGEVLAGRRLDINTLGAQVAARVAEELPPTRRSGWQAPGPWAPDQPLGEGIVHFCVRMLTLQGVVCFAPRERGKGLFVLVEEWLGRPLEAVDPQVARAELVRRYLRCYGPSTPAGLAAWLGVRTGDTDPWWSLVADELTPVGFAGTSWILTEDLDALRSPPAPVGVRLLPPRDPYTQMRDRETIVDPAFHRQVWKALGEPGAVLADGEIVGTWRPRKSGRTLTVAVTPFGALPSRHVGSMREEAQLVAPLRGATSGNVEICS